MPGSTRGIESLLQLPFQQLLLNRSGQVLSSDDIIFSTSKLGSGSIFGRMPFFESLLPSLFSNQKMEGETVFPCVQMDSPELPGIYDVHFLSIFWNAEPALSCSIIERTGHYLHCQALQQRESEIALTQENGSFAR